MEKKFFLGLGAQKSGTTWLNSYLRSSDSFNLGLMKEYHIWDAIYLKACEKFLIRTLKDTIEFKFKVPYLSRKKLLRYKLQKNPEKYATYFSKLINKNSRSTADITPSYSGLAYKELQLIKNQLENEGFDVKVIFLMRDPFERCWSAIRMHKQKGRFIETDIKVLEKFYSSEEFKLRTNYKSTISNIEKVFDCKNIYYGIYEEMFTEEKLIELSNFCGVKPNLSYAERTFNLSPKNETVPDELRLEIINFYSDVYQYCNKKFPQTKRLWNKVAK